MTPAEHLLMTLRMLNIRVRLDGETVRCKTARGLIPNDLAQQIRDLKPQLLDLLLTEQQEIDWRVDAIGEGLLADRPERTPGRCTWCAAALPAQQSGKCVSCSLAAAEQVLAQLDAVGLTGQPTYPMSPISVSDSERLQRSWDMKSDITTEAA
jgi:hypothetical protein